MTIAEQIIRAKTDYDDVFKAGQLNVLNSSEVLKGNEIGAAVKVDDISKIEPSLNIKVSGQNVSDFSNVVISMYGKNLLPYPYSSKTIANYNGVTYTDNGDGTITVSGIATGYSDFTLNTIQLSPNTQYCFSGYENCTNIVAVVAFFDVDNKNVGSKTASIHHSASQRILTFNSADYPTAVSARISVKRNNNSETSGVIKPQLEIGNTDTEYEPYVEPQIIPVNADGTVEGINNLYTNLTLITDTDGTVINVNYFKDIDKTFNKLEAQIVTLGGELA